MTNNIYHFETCVPNNRNNKGRIKVTDSDSMKVRGRETVTWKLEDDDGVVHKIKMKASLCVPNVEIRPCDVIRA